MKKAFAILNAIAIPTAAIVYILYRFGEATKGQASLAFVLIGLCNLVYTILRKRKVQSFPLFMTLGLIFCMLGDIVIEPNFIVGAALFALGHVWFCVAYTRLAPCTVRDLPAVLALFVPAALLVTFAPFLHFDSPVLQVVCIVYALIISCMVGKAITNLAAMRTRTRLILLIGSCLFFFSDLMLVFNWFAGLSFAGPLCLDTYYPAQYFLAFSIYYYTNEEA